MNELGDIAFIWGIDVGPGVPNDALFFEEEILLREGDAVDWDGDGVVDPAVTLAGFTGTNSITLANNGTIYFTADVNVNGSRLEGFFIIESPLLGTNYCTPNPNSSGQLGLTRALGSSFVGQGDVTLTADFLPPLAFGFFITSPVQGLVLNPGGSSGNLCLAGSIGRYVGPGQIQQASAAGTMSLMIDVTQMPQPNGFVAAVAGDHWSFQTWYRDSSPAGATSNFTNGFELAFN